MSYRSSYSYFDLVIIVPRIRAKMMSSYPHLIRKAFLPLSAVPVVGGEGPGARQSYVFLYIG